jgi:hypothetical protein
MTTLRTTLALLLMLVATPALALGLDEAKRQGLVGEQVDGYLGAVRPSPEVAELVRTIQKTNLRKTSLSKLVIQS